MDRKVAIINVGVNRSHWNKGLISPLFDDGTYEYLPIPEEGYGEYRDCPNLKTYAELFKGKKNILDIIPEKWHDVRTHHDPEFETYTYGDSPDSPEGRVRGRALKELKEKGALLFFFCRLTKTEGGEGRPYFFGFFEIESCQPGVKESSSELLHIYGKNAHILKGEADPRYFDGFWVWKGSDNSKQFEHPVRFDRELTRQIIRDKDGMEINWPLDDTPEFRIWQGLHTRPCKLIEKDDGKKALLRKVLEAHNEIPLFQQLLR